VARGAWSVERGGWRVGRVSRAVVTRREPTRGGWAREFGWCRWGSVSDAASPRKPGQNLRRTELAAVSWPRHAVEDISAVFLPGRVLCRPPRKGLRDTQRAYHPGLQSARLGRGTRLARASSLRAAHRAIPPMARRAALPTGQPAESRESPGDEQARRCRHPRCAQLPRDRAQLGVLTPSLAHVLGGPLPPLVRAASSPHPLPALGQTSS